MSYIDSANSRRIPLQPQDGSKVDGSRLEKIGKTKSGKEVRIGEAPHRPRKNVVAHPKSTSVNLRGMRSLGTKATPERAEAAVSALKGHTIDPKVATKFMDRVQFDHLGRIVDIKKPIGSFTRADLMELTRGEITDLAKTNSKGPRDVARIETEIMVDFVSQLSKAAKSAGPEAKREMKGLADAFKLAWLTGKTDSETVSKMLGDAATKLQSISPELAESAKALQKEAKAPKQNTQYHDNILARRFETEFVNLMVANPAPSVLTAANDLGRMMHKQIVDSCPPDALPKRLEQIVERLKDDPRPWTTEMPHVGAFLNDPTPDNFRTMMTTNTSGFDVIKQSWVGVKASLAITAPWMQEATSNYDKVVVPARSETPSVFSSTGVQMIPTALRDMRKVIIAAQAELRGLMNPTDAQNREKDVLQDANLKLNGMNRASPKELQKALQEIRSSLRKLNPEVANTAKSFADEIKQHLKTDKSGHIPLVESGMTMSGTAMTTRGFGTALPHQPSIRSDAGNSDAWQAGLMVQSKVHMDVDAPTPFETTGIEANRYFVNGASGSTNVMMHAIEHFAATDHTFNKADAFAGVMMFLTFDGGHSLSESTGTYKSLLSDQRSIRGADGPEVQARRRDALANHVADFVDLANYYSSADTKLAVQQAVDGSFDRVLSSFDEMHSARS